MKIIEWKDDFSVGDPLMDAHHKQFLQIVHELNKAITDNKQTTDKKSVLDFLIEYVEMHLRAEERLMKKIGYPELKDHEAKHQEFENKIFEIEGAFKKDTASLKLEDLLGLAQDWLISHILTEDKKYQPYV